MTMKKCRGGGLDLEQKLEPDQTLGLGFGLGLGLRLGLGLGLGVVLDSSWKGRTTHPASDRTPLIRAHNSSCGGVGLGLGLGSCIIEHDDEEMSG